MNDRKDEKWLDEQISRTIDSGKPQFNAKKWKEKYPQEFQFLLSRTGQTSRARKANLCRTVIKSKITKLAAAAAVIVLAVGLFVARRVPEEQVELHTKPEVAKSPAEMMTAMSLTIAYREGGMEAVEEQYNKAYKQLGPRPKSLSVEQILSEFNGT